MSWSSRHDIHGARLRFSALIAELLVVASAATATAGASAPAPPPDKCDMRQESKTDDANRTFSPLYYCSTKAATLLYANPDRTFDRKEPPLDDSGSIKGARTELAVVCQKKGRANPSQTGTTAKNSHWLYTKGDEGLDNSHLYKEGWGYLPANMVTQATKDDEAVPGVPTCPSSPPPVVIKLPPRPAPPPGGCTDCDGDRFPSTVDCNDVVAAVNPGAKDIPGNAVDEDCSDGPAPFPRLDSTIGYAFGLSGKRTVFTRLSILSARTGSTIRVSCFGRDCPFKTKTRAVSKDAGKLSLAKLVRRPKLRSGAQLEVRVTKPNMIGIVRRFTIRAGKDPKTAILCLTPNAKRPTRCGL